MQLKGRAILASRAGQLFLFVVAGGAISVWRRQDINWDLQNYHFYNPWAWLNGRLGFDLAPAQIQTYLSPLLDVPFFLLVQAGVAPILIGFLMGIPFGIAVAFFFWIAAFACQDLPRNEARVVLVLSLLVALTGAAGMPTVGSTMNEWHTAALVMPALFIALKSCAAPEPPPAAAAWTGAGFLLGAATGLKLTAAPYALAVGVAAALMHRFLSRAQAIALLGLLLGGSAGFAAAYGYWAIVLTQNFQNPVFPFFNGIFRSPDWFASSFRDGFGPKSVLEALLFPLQLAERGVAASNTTQRDARVLVLFAGLVALACSAALGRAGRAKFFSDRRIRFLGVFTLAAYAIWLLQFSIYRYFIPVELIGSLLLVLCAWFLLPGMKWRPVIVGALCLGIMAYTDRPQWGRKRFGDTYFGVSVPAIPDGSLVLLYGGEPLAYLLPFLGTAHRYVRPSSNFTHPSHSHGLQRKIDAAIRTHAGPIYAIRKPDQDLADEALVLTRYRLRLAEQVCLPVRSDIHPGLMLCRLLRTGT